MALTELLDCMGALAFDCTPLHVVALGVIASIQPTCGDVFLMSILQTSTRHHHMLAVVVHTLWGAGRLTILTGQQPAYDFAYMVHQQVPSHCLQARLFAQFLVFLNCRHAFNRHGDAPSCMHVAICSQITCHDTFCM